MRIITKGATDQSVELYIADNTTGLPATGLVFNSSGIDLWYRRPGAGLTSITEVTLAFQTSPHADGGFLEIGNGNYRLDLPDAAVATGVDHVAVGGTITGYTVYPVTVQLSAFALQTVIQSVDVRSLPSVWYVATTGNDSNDGKTLATPKLTLTATHTASNPGDTIRIAAGTYSGNFTFSKDNQTWIGVDQNTCVITDPTGATIVVSGNNVSLKNLTINSTGTTTSDVGLAFFGTYGFYGENLTVTGAFDAIQAFNAFYPTLINVNATGKYDAANFGNTPGTYCRNCRFITTADFSPSTDDFRAFHAINGSTDPYATTTFGVLEDCLFLSKRTGSSTAGTGGLHLSGSWHLINPTIYAEVANAATTGRCFGIDDNPQVAHITVVGGSITLSNAGSGATRDAMTTVIGSSIALLGVECIEANFEGNVYNATPTAAKINTAVEAGAVGTDATTAATQASAANTRVQTGVPNAVPGDNGGLPTVNASNQVAGVSGNVVGSVGSVTGAVGSVTGNVGGSVASVTGAVGSVTGNVGGNVAGSVGSVTSVANIQSGLATSAALSTLTSNVSAINTLVLDVPTNAEMAVTASQVTTINSKLGAPVVSVADDLAATKAQADSIKTDTGTTLPAAIEGIEASVDLSPITIVTDKLDLMIDDGNPAAPAFTEPALAEAPTGGGVIPVNQVVVPASRTWLLVETEDGLHSEEDCVMRVGETKVFAVDFRNDLPTNGRLEDVDSIAIGEGTSGGVTFAASATDPGVDKTQAKVSITAVTAGTYEIEFDVEYQAGEGGGSSKGVVTLIVTE